MCKYIKRYLAMEYKIDGNRYKFGIRLIKFVYFEIVAVRKKDNKKSSITNLNTIIAEVIHPVLGARDVEETYITVNGFQTGKKLFDHAVEVLNNSHWVHNFLEIDLDEDFEE